MGSGEDRNRSLRQCLKSISLQECVRNHLDSISVELLGEMAWDSVGLRWVASRL